MAGIDEERQRSACMKRDTAAALAFHAFFLLRGAQEDPNVPYKQHSPVPLIVLINTLSAMVSNFTCHIQSQTISVLFLHFCGIEAWRGSRTLDLCVVN